MDTTYEQGKVKNCVIITGMSGGGKSSALTVFEDQGYYAIDNLPPTLLPQLVEVLKNNQAAITNGVAAVVDVREEELLNELHRVVSTLRDSMEKLEVIFMDASDEALVRRFETTRRRHPLSSETTLLENINAERKMLVDIRESADVVIDTSELTTSAFKNKLLDIVGGTHDNPVLIFSSFGFKNGVPQDADYIIDVRFLPNPNYVPQLHNLSGKDSEIREYLSKYEDFHTLLEKSLPLFAFVYSVYGNTGKKHLHVAIGCTGGRHRSVAVCECLAEEMKKTGAKVVINHRDINKENLW